MNRGISTCWGWKAAARSVLVLCVAASSAAAQATETGDEGRDVETIVVTGTRPVPSGGIPLDHVPANVQRLDDGDVEAFAPLNVTDLLGRRAASVHLTQTQNNPYQPDLIYRGFTSSFLLGTPQGLSVYQDGIRLNDFLGDAMNWDLVPEDSFSSFELVPGGNPVFGRNTLGGAIVLQSKSGKTHPGTSAEVSYGSFKRRHLTLQHGGTAGDFDYFVMGDVGREDGFRDFSKGEVARLFTRVGWSGENDEVWFTYNLARNDLRGNGFVAESLLDEDRSNVFTHPDIFEPALDFVTAHWTHRFTDTFRVDAAAYFRRLDIDQFNADGDDDDDEEEEGEEADADDDDEGEDELIAGVNNDTTIEQRRIGGTLQASHHYEGSLGGNSFAVGFEGEGASADVRFTAQEGFVNERRTVIATGDPELATDVETSGTSFGVFATDTYTPLEWVSFTASLRYDRSTVDIDNLLDPAAGGEHTFERVNPALGMNVRPHDGMDFYVSAAESFRVPSAIELSCANEDDPCPLPIAFADDPPLEDVKSRTYEVGFRARPSKAARFSVAAYRTRLEDDILFVAASRAEGFFQNVDETRRMGVEVGLDGRLSVFDYFMNYAYTEATFEATAALPSAAGENVARPGDELPGVPNHLFKAGVDARLPWGFRLGADLQYTGEQFLRGDEANDFEPLDDYVVVNARLAWTRGPVTLFARAENLFDAEYESFGTFGENVFNDERVERFLSPGAPLGGWFGLRVEL